MTVCPVCGKPLRESLESHILAEHYDRSLAQTLAIMQSGSCIVCGSQASLEPSLKQHLWDHHSRRQLLTALVRIVSRHQPHNQPHNSDHCVLCGLEQRLNQWRRG